MKIAIRGGHNFQAVGASAIIDETTEDRKVKDAAIRYLQQLGHSILDVTPGNCDTNTDLAYGVNKANSWGADVFASIHFNKAYDSYNGAIGTEAWIYDTGGQAEIIANRVVNRIASQTGLKNRGVKVDTRLYEPNKTKMPAMIIEVCFVEATEDVRIYREKGSDFIGKCIAEAIANTTINVKPSVAAVGTSEPQANSIVKYKGQVQNVGWQGWVSDGQTSGTEGKELRLEALQVDCSVGNLTIQGHVQNIGWQAVKHNNEVIGTVGQSLRLEAVKMTLDNPQYSIQYQVHVQDIGWMSWACDGAIAGTVGQGKRIEAIRIKAVKR